MKYSCIQARSFDDESRLRPIMPSIWCALRTFDEHAKEMGGLPSESPLFFLKPWGAFTQPAEGNQLSIPDDFDEVHHEVELVLQLGANLSCSQIAVGLDLTDRCLQQVAKEEGMPWTQSKGFVNSAVVGNFSEAPNPEEMSNLRIELSVNDESRQSASIGQMRFHPLELIDELNEWAPMEEGDLLFCGTPSGVGPMHRGDHIHARLLTEGGRTLSEINVVLA